MPALSIDLERHARGFVLLALILGIIAIWAGGIASILFMLAAGALFVVGCFSRDQGLLLFGPFVRYELIRMARRYRLPLWRSLYALILLGVLAWIYGVCLNERGQSIWLEDAQLSIREMADFAAMFFGTFIAIQALTVLFLAPGFLSEVIAEEKDRDRLQFLLATDLRNREIVFGKIASRLAFLFSFVLVGLPVVAMLPLFGGVDPSIMMGATLGTLITLMGITGIAIFASVFSRTAKEAAATVTGIMFLYFVVSGAMWLLTLDDRWAHFPSTPNWRSPVTVTDLVEWVNVGNPLSVMTLMVREIQGGASVDNVVFAYLRGYATFHFVVLVLFGYVGVSMLRVVAANQAGGDAAPQKTTAKTQSNGERVVTIAPRPEVTDRPILWKEIHFNQKRRHSTVERVIYALVALVSLLPIGIMIYLSNEAFGGTESVNVLIRVMTAAVASVFILHASSIAARSIAREKDKQTYEAMILTGMDPRDILWQKWLGAFVSSRHAFYWLIVNWLAAVVLGGLNVMAIFWMTLAIMIYHSFGVSLGIWCSVRASTAENANKRVNRALAIPFGLMIATAMFGQSLPNHLIGPLIFAELPFLTIGALGFRSEDIASLQRYGYFEYWVVFLLFGMAIFGLFAVKLWREAAAYFERDPEAEGRAA